MIEALVVGTNVSNLRLSGISFQHTTWYQPATPHGYAEVQSGQFLSWPMWPGRISGGLGTTPGALLFHQARNITIASSELTLLGAAGISFSKSQFCLVQDSYMHDLSGCAVQFGEFEGPHATLAPPPDTPAAERELNNTLADSVIVQAGIELRGSAAVSVGYTLGPSSSFGIFFVNGWRPPYRIFWLSFGSLLVVVVVLVGLFVFFGLCFVSVSSFSECSACAR